MLSMRKLLIPLALVAAFFAFNVTSASAATPANCEGQNDVIFWQNALSWNFQVTNCVNVDAVQFALTGAGTQAALREFTPQGNVYHPAFRFIGGNTQAVGTNPSLAYKVLYQTAPWCPIPMTVASVYPQGVFRIHNRSQNSWGSWHYSGQPTFNVGTYNQVIWC